MRVCASSLKPRPSQRKSSPLAVLQNFSAFTQCSPSSRPSLLPPCSSTRKLSIRGSHLKEPNSPRWDALRTPGESEKAQADDSFPGLTDGKVTDDNALRPPQADTHNPEAWVLLLEKFLPAHSTRSSVKPNARPIESNQSCTIILAILRGASSKANLGTDLLAYLGLRQGRWQAALDLTNLLLQNIGAKVPSEPAKWHLPGLSWPRSPALDELCSAPIHIDEPDTFAKEGKAPWERNNVDPRYAEIMSQDQDYTMTQIWKSLGYIIIEAADLEGDKADAAMRFAYRAIAQIHNFGLVPDNVYTYVPSHFTSSVVRPPTMHLLSSRILTTLSDAVWRAHQDDVIAQAVNSGIGYKDLGHDPPGGRFRLKVRPLGPEVWLEFVLWCCVDGGFASAGTKIIRHLRQRIDKPWFAVNWMVPDVHSSTSLTARNENVDWSRVRLRVGGTVGRIEGYSTEQPFAVMEPRTISTEVVLALVESLTNSLNVGIANRGSSLAQVQTSIKSLISFLEPHHLPLGYFDHLAVKLQQSGGYDPDRSPGDVQSLANTFLYMQSLETAGQPVNVALSFSLEATATHSEFLNGLFHQSLEAFVNLGDVRRALEVFAEIQQLVDSSKLRSITIFLSTLRQQSRGYFSSRTVTVDEDFVVSHGQLPLYKLAAFLDLVTDSRLVRLGNWLLYSEDVDGPLIPESSYAIPCISPPLIRYAAVSQNQELANKVFRASHDQPIFPSVTFFRSLANTNMALSHYTLVHKILQRLTKAKAGGFSPENLASLAAGILSLENRAVGGQGSNTQTQVHVAQEILHNLLEGFYNGNIGVYRDGQRALAHRQVASILRILECIPDTNLSDAARSWRSRFDSGNDVNLFTADFNILLFAIVETKGAKAGTIIWDLFCEDPRGIFERYCVNSDSHMFIPGLIEDDENEWDHGRFLRSSDERAMAVHGYRHIPIVEVEELPADEVGNVAHDVHISDTGYEDAEEEPSTSEDESIGFDSELNSNNLLDPLERTKSNVDTSESASAPASIVNPVVRPDLRTLRIIVRGALNERRTCQVLGQYPSEQQEILTWSEQFFRAFGIRGKAIQEETQSFSGEDERLGDARPTLTEEKRLYTEARRKLRLRERRPVNVSSKFLSGNNAAKRMPPLVRVAETRKETEARDDSFRS